MRAIVLSFLLLPLLAACDSGGDALTSGPGTVIRVDDQPVKVVSQGGRRFAAESASDGQDAWATYRQKRAIEVLSLCRIGKVISGVGTRVLLAEVNCPHPRLILGPPAR